MRIPLDALALGFARFITGDGLSPTRAAAARRLAEACWQEPFMVAGTGRFCTDTMTLFGRRVFVKTGAEGVFCAAFPDLGLGVAVKADDGADRASEALMATVIDALLPMSEAERARFADRMRPPIGTAAERKSVKSGRWRAWLNRCARAGRVRQSVRRARPGRESVSPSLRIRRRRASPSVVPPSRPANDRDRAPTECRRPRGADRRSTSRR